MTTKFRFYLKGGAQIVGPVRGCGGMCCSLDALLVSHQRVLAGLDHKLPAPEPYCLSCYPHYSAASDGLETIVDLREVTRITFAK
jgi:hypothetical protein